jgi:D-alanyl-D-alanine carboxypeptidase
MRHVISGCVASLALAFLVPASATAAPTIDQVVLAARTAFELPAASAALITPDQIVVRADGQRIAGVKLRVATGDKFHVGSDGKAMFATMAARLVESGKVRWDTTLEEVFPELIRGTGVAYRNVTLQDLLRHRGGIAPLLDIDEINAVRLPRGKPQQQRASFVRWALNRAPAQTPGTVHEYSNGGYVVAAAMIERLTGKTFEALMETLLYRPLRMEVKYAWPASGELFSQPWGHEFDGLHHIPRSPYWVGGKLPEWLVPASGVSLSTFDFARFVQLHLRGLRGQGTLLSPASFAKLHEPVDGYAFGWAVSEQDGRLVSSHVGATGLFAAAMAIDAENGRAAVLMANGDTPDVEAGLEALAILMTSPVDAVTP